MRNSLALQPRSDKIAIPLLISKPRAHIPASGEDTMNTRERRNDTRVNIRVPFRFRVLTIPGSPEQVAESENISQRGILFATTFPLQVGTPLEVSLEMPRELAGRSSTDMNCVARVVRVQPDEFLGGKAGIGLHIEEYQAVAAAGVGASRDLWSA
jgi:hypothetical protein